MNPNYKLDKKDNEILSELDKNARQSNNRIGKKVKSSKEVIKYRIDKMIEQGAIIRFHTVIDYFKLRIVKYKLYLRLNASREKIEEIANYFFKHKNTEWVATCTGRWDIIIGFLVHNVNEFDDEILILMNKYAKHIQERAVTTTLYLAHHAREFLERDNKGAVKIVYHTSKDPQEKIDKIDEDILKAIANNARMPIVDIASKLKTTPRIIQYRLKELEKKGIILAYKVHLNPKAIGRMFCKAIIYLANINKKELDEFIDYSSSLKGAVWPQKVMGNWDFELDFELEDYEKFQEIILDLKERFPNIIKNYEFCIISKEYKLDLYPNCYPKF